MEEDEIDLEPLVVDAEPPAADEGEIVAQLRQDGFEGADQRLLEVSLGILVLEIKEFEHQRVLDLLLEGEGVAGP
jgi:hypothetical protein